jgi:hypothetical protein
MMVAGDPDRAVKDPVFEWSAAVTSCDPCPGCCPSTATALGSKADVEHTTRGWPSWSANQPWRRASAAVLTGASRCADGSACPGLCHSSAEDVQRRRLRVS